MYLKVRIERKDGHIVWKEHDDYSTLEKVAQTFSLFVPQQFKSVACYDKKGNVVWSKGLFD